VAFPSISTGAYGYPISAAAAIAVATTSTFLKTASLPAEVIFCCFSQKDLLIYERELRTYRNA
jgi:O-acetyl-ADP-ribose deacetylase (regulator of RNase III)